MAANAKFARRVLVALAALLGAPMLAKAQPPNPVLVGKPTAVDVATVYPVKAQRSEVEGRAVLACSVQPDGLLTNCRADSEEPRDFGFGEAVLKLAPKFRYAPRTEGFETRIPIRFQLPRVMREVAFPKKPGEWASLGPIGPYYPERAERLQVDGEARIDCKVLPSNRLDECRAVAAGPPGWGFDEAAIRAAKDGWIIAGPEPAGVAPPGDGVWRFRILFEQSKRRKRSR